MSAELDLTMAGGLYDRTLALIDGRVRPDGVRLRYLPMRIEEVFWRALRHHEFEATELSLAYYISLRSRGDDSYVAIPVFPSRYFRHGNFYVRADSELDSFESVRGATVGLPEYTMTACVWQRGLLKDDCGIDATEIRWRYGGIETPGREDRADIPLPPGVELEPLEQGATLNSALIDGKVDAVMAPRVLSGVHTGELKRLLVDYRDHELEYWRRTRIFPIMHLIAIRRDVHERHPWLARSLFDAFQDAKRLAYEWLAEIPALPVSLPFYVPEWEFTQAEFGPDPWPDGLEPNRATLETISRYLVEQGCADPVDIDALFAPSVLDQFVV
jgi:4,5-dihydroxyphthalate decarboxylase